MLAFNISPHTSTVTSDDVPRESIWTICPGKVLTCFGWLRSWICSGWIHRRSIISVDEWISFCRETQVLPQIGSRNLKFSTLSLQLNQPGVQDVFGADKSGDKSRSRSVEKALRCIDLLNVSLVEDRNPTGQGHCLCPVVGDVEHRDAGFALDRFQLGP